jgi:hypothetical protein
MQTRNHVTHTLPAGRLNLSSWGSESVSVTDHVGDQVSIIGVSDANLRDAITSYVRGLRHVSTSDKAAASAWLTLLADSVTETADRLREVTA